MKYYVLFLLMCFSLSTYGRDLNLSSNVLKVYTITNVEEITLGGERRTNWLGGIDSETDPIYTNDLASGLLATGTPLYAYTETDPTIVDGYKPPALDLSSCSNYPLSGSESDPIFMELKTNSIIEIGKGTTGSIEGSIAIGEGGGYGSQQSIGIGYYAIGTAGGIGIGANANGTGMGKIALGPSANASGASDSIIAIGQSVSNDVSDTARMRGTLYLDGATGILYRSTFGTGAWVPFTSGSSEPETDPIYTNDLASGVLATGTPVYVELDPVYTNDLATGFLITSNTILDGLFYDGSSLTVTSETSAITNEADPVWSAVSNEYLRNNYITTIGYTGAAICVNNSNQIDSGIFIGDITPYDQQIDCIAIGDGALTRLPGATVPNAGDANVAIGRLANANNYGLSTGGSVALGDYANGGGGKSVAIGGNANGASGGATLGYGANSYQYGAAIGREANARTYGAAIGRDANAYQYAVAVGYTANGVSYGLAVGNAANGYDSGVAVGNGANATPYGVSIGAGSDAKNHGAVLGDYAKAGNYGIAIGSRANGVNTNIAIGAFADASGGEGRISIGLKTTNTVDNSVLISEYFKAGKCINYDGSYIATRDGTNWIYKAVSNSVDIVLTNSIP